MTVFLVPIAASVFRIGSAIAQTTAALFVARLTTIRWEVPTWPHLSSQ